MPRKRGRKSRSTWGSNDDAGAGRRRLRYWADLHDGRGYTRHSKTIVGTKTDGDEELARLRVAHSQDRPVPTVGQAYEMWWLPDATERRESGEMAKSTYMNHLSRWRLHVGPRWADVPVTDVRALDVQDWLRGLTATIAESGLTLLRQVLDACVRYEVMDRNVATMGYKMPKRIERVYSRDVYGLEEMVSALDAVRGTVAYMPAVMAGIGSCRVGESMGFMSGEVRRAEVDGMTVAVVDLVRQVSVNGKPGPDHELKTKTSERPIVIVEPWSLDVLSAAGPWLCGGARIPSQPTVRRHWEEALRAAGIEPIPLRNLRNSWRTIMRWELGVPEDKVERMMGHGGRSVGEIHYDRPTWEVFARTAADAWVRYRAGRNGGI